MRGGARREAVTLACVSGQGGGREGRKRRGGKGQGVEFVGVTQDSRISYSWVFDPFWNVEEILCRG